MHLIYGIDSREQELFTTEYGMLHVCMPENYGFIAYMIDSYRYWLDMKPNALVLGKNPVQTICVASFRPLDRLLSTVKSFVSSPHTLTSKELDNAVKMLLSTYDILYVYVKTTTLSFEILLNYSRVHPSEIIGIRIESSFDTIGIIIDQTDGRQSASVIEKVYLMFSSFLFKQLSDQESYNRLIVRLKLLCPDVQFVTEQELKERIGQ